MFKLFVKLVQRKVGEVNPTVTNLHASSFSTTWGTIWKQKSRSSLPYQPTGQELELAKAFSKEQLVVTFPTVNNLKGPPGRGSINPFT